MSPEPKKQKSAIGLEFENRAISEGFSYIAGIDEVGRGCLAGPVVAAAVILDLSKPLPAGLNDSKKLSKTKRETIAAEIRQNALCYSIGQIEAEEIDRVNILEATKLAMISAIRKLDPATDFLLIDALQLTNLTLPQRSIIKGDSISASIAAASVIAKVYRDDLMAKLDKTFPEYGFAKHAGYGTAAHFEAIRNHGACSIHRKSFRGVL